MPTTQIAVPNVYLVIVQGVIRLEVPYANATEARRAIVGTCEREGWTHTGNGDAGTFLYPSGQVAASYAITEVLPPSWRAMPSHKLRTILEVLDDSTDAWDTVADELAEREHEWETRRNNGGIRP